jgi:hypothetical protein
MGEGGTYSIHRGFMRDILQPPERALCLGKEIYQEFFLAPTIRDAIPTAEHDARFVAEVADRSCK